MSYSNIDVARLFVEASENFGDPRYKIWEIALDEAKNLYDVYDDALIPAGMAEEGQSFED